MKKLIISLLTAAFALLMTVTVYAAPTDDITADYDVPTPEQLASALLYDMAPYAADYLEAAERYGVNVYFLCAKDALESGWGRYEAASNNLGGWKDNRGKYMSFDTVPDYIDHMAQGMKIMYLTEQPKCALPDDITGIHFNGYDLEAVNTDYNGSPEWFEEAGGIWASLERKCSE